MPEKTTRALVVGGDASTRAFVQSVLDEAGYAMSEISAADALDTAPDPSAIAALVVIETDRRGSTPGLLSELRARGYHAPTVLLARSAPPRLRERAFALGALDVVSLPVDVGELLARLRVAFAAQPPGTCPHLRIVRADDP